jgi:hypothetical protein
MDNLGSRNWLTKEEATAFIGRNSEFYLDKWKSHPNTFYKGWNWAAAIFRIEWMAYRKMYLEAIIALIVVIFLGIAIDVVLSMVNIRIPNEITRFAIQILIGLFGNGLYRNKAIRTLQKTSYMDTPERLSYLAMKGSVSLVGLFVFLGLNIALIIIFSIALHYIIPN